MINIFCISIFCLFGLVEPSTAGCHPVVTVATVGVSAWEEFITKEELTHKDFR
jgi:hypothetical protein